MLLKEYKYKIHTQKFGQRQKDNSRLNNIQKTND